VAEIAEAAAHLPGLAGKGAAEHLDVAVVWPEQGGEDPQKCRLAGTVGTEDSQGLPGAKLEGDIAQGDQLPVLAPQARDLDRGSGRRGLTCARALDSGLCGH
jgi:hypothetical protein